MSVVGDNIRALRVLYGGEREITQSELASIAGVSRETVNKWESGAIGNVRTSNMDRLREHFGLSVDDLRSESAGLAARLRASCDTASDSGDERAIQDESRVPLYKLRDIVEDLGKAMPKSSVDIPASIARRHSRAFAFAVEDAAMGLALPMGCHAVADPGMEPPSAAIVLACAPVGELRPIVRRMHRGSSKVMLSADAQSGAEDIILDAEDVRVLGTVVWYQASEEL